MSPAENGRAGCWTGRRSHGPLRHLPRKFAAIMSSKNKRARLGRGPGPKRSVVVMPKSRMPFAQMARLAVPTANPEQQADELLQTVLQLDLSKQMTVYEGIRQRLLDEGHVAQSKRACFSLREKRRALCLKAGCFGCESPLVSSL